VKQQTVKLVKCHCYSVGKRCDISVYCLAVVHDVQIVFYFEHVHDAQMLTLIYHSY